MHVQLPSWYNLCAVSVQFIKISLLIFLLIYFFQPSAFSPLIPPSSQRPSSVILDFLPGDLQLKGETDDEKISVEELRTQISDLMGLVDALKKEHGRELEKLKKDLEEEKLLRSNLELEIEKLKKAVMST